MIWYFCFICIDKIVEFVKFGFIVILECFRSVNICVVRVYISVYVSSIFINVYNKKRNM